MTKRKKKKVAIVIPTFNRSKFVQKAIDSALSQTYPCEVVVCDHGSSDDTPEVMKKYGNKIKYVRKEEDFGPHFCWLDGLLHTDAEFVHLQFDDDWISNDYIEKCMKFMGKDVGVVIADAYGIFHFKEIFKKSGIFPKRKIEKRLLRGAMYSPGASLFRRKDLIDALYQGNLPISRYPSYHGVGPDSFMTLLAVLRYKKVGIVTEHLVFFREHDKSITCDAHGDPEKYEKLRNAYEDVISYYMFLKWFWLFDKFKYASPQFWILDAKSILRRLLRKVRLFNSAKEILTKIRKIRKELFDFV